MQTKISADEAHEARKDHMRKDASGREVLLKVATAPTTWNSEKRSARFVMTSQSVDRYGDIVVTTGLDTSEFEKNPQAFLNHASSQWPIGQWANVDKMLRGRPPRMEGDLVLHEKGGPIPQVDQAAWMIERGYMRACSIGFIPDFEEVEMIADKEGKWTGGYMFHKAEIIECSLCGVPANQDALAKDFGSDMQIAQETIEFILETWAHDAHGGLIERAAFESLYRVVDKEEKAAPTLEEILGALDATVALAVCEKYIGTAGKIIVSKEHHDAVERAARNMRLKEKRDRELEAIRLRGI